MNRRLALVALWAVFAAAAVGVGFGAAGLVGDPFTTGTTGTVPAVDDTPTSDPATSSPAPRPSGSATSAPSAGGPETRTLSTRGGFVSATCRDGLLRLSASPAVGWGIDDLESGEGNEGRVRFEESEDGDDRVDVRASCGGGVPRFAFEDDGGSGHGDDDGSGGGED